MKNIFIVLFLLINISIYSEGIYAYEDTNNSSYERNTELNIKGSKLIKKYLYSLLDNLNNLKEKYKIGNNIEVDKYIQTLETMIKLLSKIENYDIDKNKAENIMRVIIKELRPLNKKIKLLLKSEKEKLKIKNDIIVKKYYKLSSKLSITLNKIIINYYLPIKGKKKLNEKEKILLTNLKILKINSDHLKNMEKDKNKNLEQIKKDLLDTLKSIKKSLLIIKNN